MVEGREALEEMGRKNCDQNRLYKNMIFNRKKKIVELKHDSI